MYADELLSKHHEKGPLLILPDFMLSEILRPVGLGPPPTYLVLHLNYYCEYWKEHTHSYMVFRSVVDYCDHDNYVVAAMGLENRGLAVSDEMLMHCSSSHQPRCSMDDVYDQRQHCQMYSLDCSDTSPRRDLVQSASNGIPILSVPNHS